ncbi:MAG: DUF1697 domain-containing protein [Sphaerochaetaceae bacterium]|nr:DUF1697 domain-containing protein [Sphaerochaetaceae bacterium]
MRYIVLLRGINVGGNHKVVMKELREYVEALNFVNVSTYLNSGNLLFDSEESAQDVKKKITEMFSSTYDFDIPILIKTQQQIKAIEYAIPENWYNDEVHKTDVAYLFSEADLPEIIDELPIKKEFVDIRYVQGALFYRVARADYNKSQLNKIIGHKLYKLMTIRNINTARKLAKI